MGINVIKKIRDLTPRQIVCAAAGFLSLLLFLLLTWFSGSVSGGLAAQQMAERWSVSGEAAHVSAFFSQGTEMEPGNFIQFGRQIDSALKEESVAAEPAGEGARLWADAFSASGEITVESSKTSVKAKAVGIGGDYFLFHPLKLLYGSYFSGNDLMQDRIVIDEDMAWQLFGSNDVAGKQVTIGGVPHLIAGVVERDAGKLNKAAGNDVTTVYVSYETLTNYGLSQGINCYELVMPNPITGYALNFVRENIGVEENYIECVENSSRFSALSLGKVLLDFTGRVMNSKAIIYPYWENVARGWENILAIVLALRAVFAAIPSVMLIVFAVRSWKRRTWTFKGLYGKLQDAHYRAAGKRMERREQKKQGNMEEEPGKGKKKGPKAWISAFRRK